MAAVDPVPGSGAPEEPRWLDAAEKEAWTGLISLALLMPGRLEAPLHQEHGLTLFEYMTLSQISEAPGRAIRMSELAYLTNGSLSRLSNVVKRLEQRGWVTRSPDPADGRYTLASLTDDGYELVVAAAPVHLRAVREHVLDPLNKADRQALARIAAKLRTRPSDYGREAH
ncbi:MarR family winged helix-turn-helix transcriptional regulator [Lentzea sp. CC55]|uniref:MarR family winged helix-turn-helix transcriptional regulator n=1 Tax=Lentzea sp. CC55 TaxID=2884909 RepID=UPI0027E0E98E|nr:MarR family transcriptional regulator [Lentzea sp. CC55]MCG8923056.1 MarR family transcriptional regulator [Lentzea sp. CC55]